MTGMAANLDAEQALITAVLLSPATFQKITHMLGPDDFYKPQNQNIWAAIEQTSPDIDPILVAARLKANGFEGDDYALNRLFCDPSIPTTCISHASRYAKAIREEAARRATILTLAEATEQAWSLDTAVTREDAIRRLQQISTPDELRIPLTSAQFRASTVSEYDWLIPGFLERKNRMMITGAEGAGKSVMLTQIAFMAAAGIHPWTQRPVTPVRSLLVDLENGQRLIGRRIGVMDYGIAEAARHADLPEPWREDRMMVESAQGGIDLTTPADRDWLASLILGGEIELLVIGPVYRMTRGIASRGDVGGEDQARSLTMALDRLQQHTGVTIIIEAHAPHGAQGNRDLRPFGSSVWLRWPDFGFGIGPAEGDDKNRFEIVHWRGARDERDWPRALYRNSTPWPWVADMG